MRSDMDDWDITTSVGSTALFVAAARTLAGREDDPLVVDPLAELFLRAAGGEWALLADPDPELTRDHILRSADFGTSFRAHIAGRTRYLDDYLKAAREAGIGQVVILAAGLDARAYRLDCLEGAVVYELDRPQVLDFKRETLAAAGVEPLADRREVAVDLREEWLNALRDKGFDPSMPTAWLVEGLLIYITPEAQDQLFGTLDSASAAGSRAAIEQMTPLPRETYTELAAADQDGDEAKSDWARLIYNEPRSDAAQWFSERGWDAERTGLAEYLRAAGRTLPATEEGTGHVGAPLVNLVTVVRR
ncbi:SAM-dependent methyltransferase [Nocardia macrotermitis]|uniref:S-adenosyl-L-methionine-dependent methyltransferase n=1 Tax=Nocardia macrotermitis TaxID=2585198 RepID=A0A7K0D1U6_9NOCA|nr:SAM-dependent methyltransferase [Nocardia macrotermitis]MQY18914.1 putative S-adenosyl-L-methionine-dependent methyltransferase [Nocardia macrotermitis]